MKTNSEPGKKDNSESEEQDTEFFLQEQIVLAYLISSWLISDKNYTGGCFIVCGGGQGSMKDLRGECAKQFPGGAGDERTNNVKQHY